MLKIFSSSASRQIYLTHLASPLRAATGSLNSISGSASRGSGLGQRAFFRSSDSLVRKAVGGRNSWDVDEWLAEQQSTNVPVFPMLRPLVPGDSTYINGPISDALFERLKRQIHCVCPVLLKDAPGIEEDMYKLKGKELLVLSF